MSASSSPETEEPRLAALHEYHILDTLPEQAYDDITFIATQMAGTPIALISFTDRDRQWFKSHPGLDLTEVPRQGAPCAQAIRHPDELLIVRDARKDPRFARHPLVKGAPGACYYAGAPLISPGGHALGTLCVVDHDPRQLSEGQLESLRALARQVVQQLELRRATNSLRREFTEHKNYERMIEGYQRKLDANNERLQAQSSVDTLTGALNRRAFCARLEDEFHRAARYNRALSLIVLQVDEFAVHRKVLGDQRADDVVRHIADTARQAKRTSDILARLSGDEFVVILPDTDKEGAFRLAERLRQGIEKNPLSGRPVTVSAGVASVARHIALWEELVGTADRALLQAREHGGNCVRQDGSTPDTGGMPVPVAVRSVPKSS